MELMNPEKLNTEGAILSASCECVFLFEKGKKDDENVV